MMELAEGEITKGPNWLTLPREVTAIILQKLDVEEIVTSASQVCSLWRNICKDPSMWCSIFMTEYLDPSYNSVEICCYAVKQSCGHLEDIYIESFATDDLLMFIANSTSNLRRLGLAYCKMISEKGLLEVVKKSPLLEELEISFNRNITKVSLEAIGRCCPLLKTLKHNRMDFVFCWPPLFNRFDDDDDDDAFTIAKTMPQLRHLQIIGNTLSNDGLLAILDSCPLLESLDILGCYNVNLSGSLGKKCNEKIKDLRVPLDGHKIPFAY